MLRWATGDPGAGRPQDTATPEPRAALADLLRGRAIVALTGAGCSTESGIPDYRGAGTLARARNPIQHQAFLTSHSARARYWARSAIGWPRIRDARPNAAHRALAQLEQLGVLRGVITQNVDRLHRAAGSREVVELHGAVGDVVCLACGEKTARDALQSRLLALNAGHDALHASIAPDGDADLEGAALEGFVVPACLACGGVLKPDVVFFGGNVARAVVERAYGLVDGCEALLVVGTSLAVFSGLRFVRRAAERGVPIAIVNLGPTRGDPHASLTVDASAGEAIPELAAVLARDHAREAGC